MKKLLLVLAIGTFAACNNASTSTEAAADSTISVIDSTADAVIDSTTAVIDSTAGAAKDSVQATVDTLKK